MKKTKFLCVFAFVTLLSFASVGFALYRSMTPWSTYRHDADHSGSTLSDAPGSNSTAWASGFSTYGLIQTTTPVVVDGRVIFAVRESAYAVDETTGVRLWKYPTDGLLTALAYADGRVFYGFSEGIGGIISINASTGQQIWNQTTSAYFVMSSPLVHESTVYAGATDNKTYAFDAITGDYKWEYQTNGSVIASPAADGDLLFFGSTDGNLYALNVSDLAPTSAWNFTANGPIRSTPAIENGRIFFGTDAHTLYALNETTGELIWTWTTTDTNIKLRNGVSVANSTVYVTSADVAKVYSLRADAASGNYTEADPDIVNWARSVSSDYGVSGLNEPVYANGTVIVTSTGGDPGKLYAFDAETGNTNWDRIIMWWPALGNVVVADGRAWFDAYWWEPGSLTLYCIGDLFPPTIYDYTVNAGGASFDVTLETNSTITDFNTTDLETQGRITLKVQGISATGMCNITLPDAMLGGPFNVTVDGEQPIYMASETLNATYTSLYFIYNDTVPHVVEITGTTFVPEFPTTVIAPMLMTTLFVAFAISKRKRNK